MKRYYFTHDYNARNDPKLQKLLMQHGMAAIGVYWCIIEMMYEQGGELPLDACNSIAFALHVECKLVEDVFASDLFYAKSFCIRSHSLDKRINNLLSLSEKRKKAALTRWKSASDRDMQMHCKCNANALQTECKSIAIKRNKIKEKKIIKENMEVKEKNSTSTLRKDESWSEAILMKHHITPEQLQAYLSEFEIDQRCRGGTEHDSERDLKQHFASWLMIRRKNEREETLKGGNPLGLYGSAEKDYKSGGW